MSCLQHKIAKPYLFNKINKCARCKFQLVGKYDVVVNCTGLESRNLLGDKTIYPIRGQLVRVIKILAH